MRDGLILLGLRSASARSHPLVWDVIGGHCEAGESDEETLVRELREELGITAVRYRSLGVFHEPEDRPAFRLHLFLVDAWDGTPANCSHEHSAIAWHDPTQLEDLPLASPRYRAVLADLVSHALIRKVDCVSLPVSDLEQALAFYRGRLGHRLIWRSDTAAGLRLPDTDAELVVHTESRPQAAELLVASVADAVRRFVAAGGTLLSGPFEIAIGSCAVVRDPWGNALVLLDMSKGPLETDDAGRVVQRSAREGS
jgi:8-oxo-dGTP pyrophosphatase MutT (NUDIX family)/catechol 2,3-dioxygenase-like lactoylglutathione lyase family enzyme